MQETQFHGVAEIVRKLCGKCHFRIRKSSTKYHIKVGKPWLNCGKPFSKWVRKKKDDPFKAIVYVQYNILQYVYIAPVFLTTKLTFVNFQHQNTNSKGDFVLKNWC